MRPAYDGRMFDPDKLYLFGRGSVAPTIVFRTWSYPGGVPLAAGARLADDAEVLDLSVDGQHRAYPLYMIASHHVVQDRVGTREVLVTF